MISSDIRAVFFDAVGTLIAPDPPAAAVYADVGKKHGCDIGIDQVAMRFRTAFRDEEKRDALAGWAVNEEREVRRWQAIVGQVFGDHPNLEAIFVELYRHFAQPQAWRVLDRVADVLHELAARGLVLGVASNFDHRLHAIAAGHPELAQLRHRVVSSEAGYRKPSPRFFDAVTHAASCRPEQILFVGDDRANDYDGATAAGLRAVLLQPSPTPGMRSISSLRELIEPID